MQALPEMFAEGAITPGGLCVDVLLSPLAVTISKALNPCGQEDTGKFSVGNTCAAGGSNGSENSNQSTRREAKPASQAGTGSVQDGRRVARGNGELESSGDAAAARKPVAKAAVATKKKPKKTAPKQGSDCGQDELGKFDQDNTCAAGGGRGRQPAKKPAKKTGIEKSSDPSKQIHTKAFKQWFGDWKNDPQNASKIVTPNGEPQDTFGYSVVRDDEGNPLVVYHGTTHEFNEFDAEHCNQESHMGCGFYFSSSVDDSEGNYAGKGPDLNSRIMTAADNLSSEGTSEAVADLLLKNNSPVKFDTVKDAIREKLQESEHIRDVDKALTALAKINTMSDPDHIGGVIAESQLHGGGEKLLKTYLNIRKPVVLGDPTGKTPGESGTRFYLEYTETDSEGRASDHPDFDSDTAEITGETGSAVKLMDAIREVATREKYNDVDVDAVLERVQMGPERHENAYSLREQRHYGLADNQEITAVDVHDAIQNSVLDANVPAGEFARDVFEEMGFDGVVYLDASKHFTGMNITPGTKHYIAWKPEQIKSADGNSGDFDPTQANIYKKLR